MKKNLLFLVFTLLLPMGFMSCGGDDDDEDVVAGSTLREKAIGTWVMTEIYKDSKWVKTSEIADWETTTATFTADGRYKGAGEFGSGEGTFTVDGNTIFCDVTVKGGGKGSVKYVFEQLDGRTATMSMSFPGSSVYRLKAEKR